MLPIFHRLWGAQTMYGLGAQLTTLAVPVFAVRQMGATALEVSAITAAIYLPYLLFSLHVGVLADRVPKGKLLAAVDAARMVALAGLLFMSLRGQASFIFLLSFVVVASGCTVVRDIGLSTCVGLLVDRDALPRANARLGQSKAIAEILGLVGSGALLAHFDFRWVVAMELLVMSLALALSMTAVRLGGIDSVLPRTGPSPAWSSIREGLRFLLATRPLRELAVRQISWNLCIFMVVAALIPLFTRELHFSDSEIGTVMAAMSAGTLLGSTIIARYQLRLSGLRPLSFAAYVGAVSYLLLPSATLGGGFAPFLAAGLRMLVGLSVSVFFVAAQSARQAEAPAHMQGRIAATVRFVSFGVIPLGSLAGGMTSNLLGPGQAVALASIVLLATTFALDSTRWRRVTRSRAGAD